MLLILDILFLWVLFLYIEMKVIIYKIIMVEVANHRLIKNFSIIGAHSPLRNIIERYFGALKVCFPILKMMLSYKPSKQPLIVIAWFTLHNFIRSGLSIMLCLDNE